MYKPGTCGFKSELQGHISLCRRSELHKIQPISSRRRPEEKHWRDTVKRSVSGMSRFTAARKNSDWKVSSLCLLSNTIDNVNTGSKMDEQRTGYTEQQLEDDRFSEYNIT